jgi:hypothetical protein
MKPNKPLPLPPEFPDAEAYVDSLLHFGTSCTLLRTLCGGIHINDFFNRDPDLYTQVLPPEWRTWFKSVEIFELLDLLMRENLQQFQPQNLDSESTSTIESESTETGNRNSSSPPQSLIRYIVDVRRHLLDRSFQPNTSNRKMDRKIAVGMNVKKVHEVENFSHYVDELTSTLNDDSPRKITHLVDFGAGQNYLGRALASQPYNRNIIPIESRSHVVEGAKKMDVMARITERQVVMRNKKAYRKLEAESLGSSSNTFVDGISPENHPASHQSLGSSDTNGNLEPAATNVELKHNEKTKRVPDDVQIRTVRAKLEVPKNGQGTIQYVEHRIKNSNLEAVIDQIVETHTPFTDIIDDTEPGLMVISLHSCGNLLHHGIRTLTQNPSVRAVALVGCCYNLLTERLGPPTFKVPFLREHPRLEETGNTCDPDGFPMSERFANYRHLVLRPIQGSGGCYQTPAAMEENANGQKEEEDLEEGIRLNITARMMAVQAPQNWNEEDSAGFFKRHFFRALLQRVFMEKGVIEPPPSFEEGGVRKAGKTAPIIIGTLSKKCYQTFTTYVRGVVAKLSLGESETGKLLQERIGSLSDEEIEKYEERFAERKKELSIIWSLMAFSAGVVEAMVVVDRWVFLKEQDCVADAWVEPVFDYGLSPRNLVVVGVKK